MNDVSKIQERMFKMAALTLDMGSPRTAGHGIAQIIKFLMRRVPQNRHQELTKKLRAKIWQLNDYSISSKKIVPTTALGQSITFIKNVLMGHNPAYIREVIKNITINL